MVAILVLPSSNGNQGLYHSHHQRLSFDSSKPAPLCHPPSNTHTPTHHKPSSLSTPYIGRTKVSMQFLIATTALFASALLASPVAVVERQTYTPCSGLYGIAQCCATDVLGVADLDCADPATVPTNATEFQSECAAIGQQARCCVLPIVRIPAPDDCPAAVN